MHVDIPGLGNPIGVTGAEYLADVLRKSSATPARKATTTPRSISWRANSQAPVKPKINRAINAESDSGPEIDSGLDSKTDLKSKPGPKSNPSPRSNLKTDPKVAAKSDPIRIAARATRRRRGAAVPKPRRP